MNRINCFLFAPIIAYNLYDKPLFASQVAANIYRPTRDIDTEIYNGEQRSEKEIETIISTDRFRPDRGFLGAEKVLSSELSQVQQRRDGPVQFERSSETTLSTTDPFGLDQFLTEAKKGKQAMSLIGPRGAMHANAGGSSHTSSTMNLYDNQPTNYEERTRHRVEFQKETGSKRARHDRSYHQHEREEDNE
jgi:hypothetical protein